MVCDRVAIIVEGRIRYQGRIEDFLEAREHRADVVVSGLSPEAGQILMESFEGELRGHGERIELRVLEKEVDEVLRRVLDDGGRIVSVTARRASLESVFLAAVGRGRAGGVASSEERR